MLSLPLLFDHFSVQRKGHHLCDLYFDNITDFNIVSGEINQFILRCVAGIDIGIALAQAIDQYFNNLILEFLVVFVGIMRNQFIEPL